MSGVGHDVSRWAEPLVARIGSVGVYATPADLVAQRRTRAERFARTVLTLLLSWISAPLAFLIPPHVEPVFVVLLIGVYFARRAWVGEWELARLSATCPRCGTPLTLKPGSVLYLPHSLTCGTCKAECWLELGEAPVVDEAIRQDAQRRTEERQSGGLGGRPPLTWSPAASDWRDRREPT